MKAMVLSRLGKVSEANPPLAFKEVPIPKPGAGELLLKVSACGVCHTELDEIEGRTPPAKLPVIPGHQVVGVVASDNGKRFRPGDRAGVAWIYQACGNCAYCRDGKENLCESFVGTGRDADGGYAEYMKVPEAFAHAIPPAISDVAAAPLLCAGAVGYRSLRLTGLANGQRLGLTGFGASAHLVLQTARHLYPDSEIFVFARNPVQRAFAMDLGAVWAGDTTETCPEKLDAIIDTTPVWTPVVMALESLKRGGRLVINAIGKEDGDKAVLLDLEYPSHLWLEKEIKSVANVQRRDISEFLSLAAEMGLRPEVSRYRLEEANTALIELRQKKSRGAKVLVMDSD